MVATACIRTQARRLRAAICGHRPDRDRWYQALMKMEYDAAINGFLNPFPYLVLRSWPGG